MRVCFICDQVFGFGKYGGYGYLLETYCDGLQRRGIDCSIVTWRGPGQNEVEWMNGVPIYSFPYAIEKSLPQRLASYREAVPLFKTADADIYHSIDARIETRLAWEAMRDRKFLIHFQDPYDEVDYQKMASVDPLYAWNFPMKLQLSLTYRYLRSVCQRSSGIYTHARYLIPKIVRLFKLDAPVQFIPNPIEIPRIAIEKAAEPTVCFLGRWDPQKRVERVFELASKFPAVHFIVIGVGRDPDFDAMIKDRYSHLANVEIINRVVSDEEKARILGRSWVLVNTSVREALPITFLEACAHKTAILSCVNPDDFASDFGAHVHENDFPTGLTRLLTDDAWRAQGERGYAHMVKYHERETVVEQWVQIYERIVQDT